MAFVPVKAGKAKTKLICALTIAPKPELYLLPPHKWARLPLAKTQKEFMIFMASLISIFATIFVVINIMLNQFVVKRVREMAHVSDEISTGHMEAPEFSVSGKDEIADLSRSFNRMRRSLEKAMKMLNE